MGETRTELRLTDLHSDLTIERHKGTREIIHSIPEINMYNQARADRVKLCVSRFTFLLPMLAELLGQISKINSTMERFLSFEANYFNGTVHCKTNGKLLLSKVDEARAQKNT